MPSVKISNAGHSLDVRNMCVKYIKVSRSFPLAKSFPSFLIDTPVLLTFDCIPFLDRVLIEKKE